MSSNMHHTFRNLAAEKTYSIDSVIEELERLRERQMSAVRGRLVDMERLVEGGSPCSQTRFSHDRPEEGFRMYHNAVLVAKALKDKRVKTVVLNEAKSFPDQILVLAPQALLGRSSFGYIGEYLVEQAKEAQQRLAGNKANPSLSPS